MPRKVKSAKPLIYVFCEGESEQAYTDYLKKTFSDVAVLKRPPDTGLFEEAEAKFSKSPKYKNSIDVTDEIWFFYDVEEKDIPKWNDRFTIIKKLRKLRKKQGIRVRLLMTSGCIEYWFMLHYKYYTPKLITVPEKEKVINEVKKLIVTVQYLHRQWNADRSTCLSAFLTGKIHAGTTERQSTPILRNSSVRAVSAASSPQIQTRLFSACPASITI